MLSYELLMKSTIHFGSGVDSTAPIYLPLVVTMRKCKVTYMSSKSYLLEYLRIEGLELRYCSCYIFT